jgi:hypothetical protein
VLYAEYGDAKKLTLSIDEAVYEGLHRIVGRGKISHFIEDLVRPYVSESALDEGYRAMAADGEREAEAREWNNALAGNMSDETR